MARRGARWHRRGMTNLTPDAIRRPDTVAAADDRPGGGLAPSDRAGVIWGLLRLSLGWIFLWSFLDKAIGLGFATGRDSQTGSIDFFSDKAWFNGGSPTEGFLKAGLHTKAPFTDMYSSLSGQAWVDWVYMLSMLLIGVALIAGVATRLAVFGAIVWMAMFYTASAIWPENNPFLDEHLVYIIVLVGIAWVGAGRYLGLGGWWERTDLVRRYPILR